LSLVRWDNLVAWFYRRDPRPDGLHCARRLVPKHTRKVRFSVLPRHSLQVCATQGRIINAHPHLIVPGGGYDDFLQRKRRFGSVVRLGLPRHGREAFDGLPRGGGGEPAGGRGHGVGEHVGVRWRQ
jgi:hypothetical protein